MRGRDGIKLVKLKVNRLYRKPKLVTRQAVKQIIAEDGEDSVTVHHGNADGQGG